MTENKSWHDNNTSDDVPLSNWNFPTEARLEEKEEEDRF
jgi:hypothetical protein